MTNTSIENLRLATSRIFIPLGTSYRNMKIETSHYAPFGRALVWSLARTLGSDFTPEIKRAWEDCYELVAQTMAAASDKSA